MGGRKPTKKDLEDLIKKMVKDEAKLLKELEKKDDLIKNLKAKKPKPPLSKAPGTLKLNKDFEEAIAAAG